jgi:hypothetical protein
MTVVVPAKIPLDMPPGQLHALEDLALTVAGVANLLAVLGGDLADPGAAAPGWLGSDAAAAAQQVTAVAGLTREMAGAVLLATARLSAHADRVAEVRREIDALREEQDEDYRSTWRRLYALDGVQAEFQFDGAAAVAIVEDFRFAEEARRRRNTALLADVADDAAATVRALGEAGAVVGGTGRPGDDTRAVAHLAALLPGWGDTELAVRGRELAHALIHDTSDDQTEKLIAQGLALASTPAFAMALLVGLGQSGVALLLGGLGSHVFDSGPAIATVLASALGAADPSGPDAPRLRRVLDAVYVSPDDNTGASDVAAVGMAAVLLAGRSLQGGGPRPALVAEWARQMLVREQVQDRDTGTGEQPEGVPQALADPVGLAVTILADQRNPSASAALLDDRDLWQLMLARFWSDGGAALSDVVESAATVAGHGAHIVRTGLELVGEGLVEGDPSEWTVSRRTVDWVSASLGRAAASQVDLVVDVLSDGSDGVDGGESALRGLGYVSADRDAARAVERALIDRLVTGADVPPISSVVIAATYLAVQEYGNRLAFALDTLELKDQAENAKSFVDSTWGLAGNIAGEAKGPWQALGLGTDYLQIGIGADGTWDNPIDRRPTITADDAAAAVLAWLPAAAPDDAAALAGQARLAFERTAAALGSPTPVVSPPSDLLEPVQDAAMGLAGRAADDAWKRVRAALIPAP